MKEMCKTTFKQNKCLVGLKNSLKINSGKGQIQLIILLALALLILIFVPFSIGISAFFLSKNVFVLLGLFLAVLGAIGLLWLPVPKNIALVLLYTGIALTFMPILFKQLGGITLASMTQ